MIIFIFIIIFIIIIFITIIISSVGGITTSVVGYLTIKSDTALLRAVVQSLSGTVFSICNKMNTLERLTAWSYR